MVVERDERQTRVNDPGFGLPTGRKYMFVCVRYERERVIRQESDWGIMTDERSTDLRVCLHDLFLLVDGEFCRESNFCGGRDHLRWHVEFDPPS